MFDNGNVRHGRGGPGTVPVLFIGRASDRVSWPNFLDRAAPALHQAAARCHDQRLAERLDVPS